MPGSRTIDHHPETCSLHYVEDGAPSRLTYTLHNTTMTITGTHVPTKVGGRGIAADLMRTALEIARAQQWRVIPHCSYAAAYLRRHPDQHDLIAENSDA